MPRKAAVAIGLLLAAGAVGCAGDPAPFDAAVPDGPEDAPCVVAVDGDSLACIPPGGDCVGDAGCCGSGSCSASQGICVAPCYKHADCVSRCCVQIPRQSPLFCVHRSYCTPEAGVDAEPTGCEPK